jgi:WG containing repeat
MKTSTKIGLVIFLAVSISRYRATAQDVHNESCKPDPELIAVPPCAIQHINGQTRILQSHLAARSFNKYGLAPAWIEGGWTYLDRQGWVVVPNVAMMDNGANDFHHGLVRVTSGGKWGLADPHGKLIVPLKYDGGLDYQLGQGWLVCSGCHMVTKNEYSWFEGGQWLRLNDRGTVIGPAPNPTPRTPPPPQQP